ncbi:MAG: NAD(+)/NADH kinase [Halobacteriaceae archaeon]
MRVGLVAQKGNHQAAYLAADIEQALSHKDLEIWFDTTTANVVDKSGVEIDSFDDCDLVICIGGDGTFLYAARHIGATPIMGVNLGEVGFLNTVPPEEAIETTEEIVTEFLETGDIPVHTIPRIQAIGNEWDLTPVINEIVIQGPQRGAGFNIGFEVRIDGSLYTGGYADGILVATPTGSSAYNLSEGGPLVRPGTDQIVINDMCAQNPMPPLVVHNSNTISVYIEDCSEGVVIGDGNVQRRVSPPTEIEVIKADTSVHIAGPEGDFFQSLKKLE